jgi:hypothetical protein
MQPAETNTHASSADHNRAGAVTQQVPGGADYPGYPVSGDEGSGTSGDSGASVPTLRHATATHYLAQDAI